MKIKGEKAAELLFMIAASILGEKEYRKVMAFLDDMTIAEDNKNKKECETELRALLSEIASFPNTGMLSDLHAVLMSKPFIVRAYFTNWLGEASEDLMNMKEVDLPDISVQNVVGYLFESIRPFWR